MSSAEFVVGKTALPSWKKKLGRPASSSILLLLTPRHVPMLESGAFQRAFSDLTPSFLRRPSFPRPPQHLRSLSPSFLLLCQLLPQNPSCHLLHLFIPLYSSLFNSRPLRARVRAENNDPVASRTDTPGRSLHGDNAANSIFSMPEF